MNEEIRIKNTHLMILDNGPVQFTQEMIHDSQEPEGGCMARIKFEDPEVRLACFFIASKRGFISQLPRSWVEVRSDVAPGPSDRPTSNRAIGYKSPKGKPNPQKGYKRPNPKSRTRDSDLTYRSFLKQVPRFRYVVAQAFCELWATSARVMACWNICAALSYLGVGWL